jgi:hypothetical protein
MNTENKFKLLEEKITHMQIEIEELKTKINKSSNNHENWIREMKPYTLQNTSDIPETEYYIKSFIPHSRSHLPPLPMYSSSNKTFVFH